MRMAIKTSKLFEKCLVVVLGTQEIHSLCRMPHQKVLIVFKPFLEEQTQGEIIAEKDEQREK